MMFYTHFFCAKRDLSSGASSVPWQTCCTWAKAGGWIRVDPKLCEHEKGDWGPPRHFNLPELGIHLLHFPKPATKQDSQGQANLDNLDVWLK